jgi:transcriptional antiterminator Rof (Rho-off)
MSDDTEAAALHARLEAIVKKDEDVEAQAATACRRIQAAHLLLKVEESKVVALEHTITSDRQRMSSLSSSSLVAASQLIPTASPRVSPGSCHPLGLSTPIYCTLYDSIQLSNSAIIPLH